MKKRGKTKRTLKLQQYMDQQIRSIRPFLRTKIKEEKLKQDF